MTWQEPKTNWKAGDSPSSSDFNRIEDNIDILGRLDRTSAYGVATGTNNYAVTLNPNPLTYYEGMCIAVKIPNQNTGPSTLNVNGLGAKPIRKQNGSAVSSGNLKAGIIYTMRYDGINFILQGEGGEGTAQPDDVVKGKTFTNDNDTFEGTLELTGNASVYNVPEGQTFYTTDPKNKLQGAAKYYSNIRFFPTLKKNISIPPGYYSYGNTINSVKDSIKFEYGNEIYVSTSNGTRLLSSNIKSRNGFKEIMFISATLRFHVHGVLYTGHIVSNVDFSNGFANFTGIYIANDSDVPYDYISINVHYREDSDALELTFNQSGLYIDDETIKVDYRICGMI